MNAIDTVRSLAKALEHFSKAANARGFDLIENSSSQAYWYGLRDEADSASERALDLLAQLQAGETARPTDELSALRAFAQDMMEDWPEGAPDGFTLQDLAVKHGLLKLAEPRPTQPCGEHCWCAEYFGEREWDGGVQCYRKTPLLTGTAAKNGLTLPEGANNA